MISPKINYQIIDSIEEVKDVILSQKAVVVDTETTGLETHSSKIKIIGVGLCWAPGEAVYIRLDNKPDSSIELKRIESILLDNPNIEKWGQNLKFDLRMFIARGLKVQNVTHDSNILNYCLMGDRVAVGFSGGHGIDEMALYYLNYIKIRTKSLIPKKSKSNKNPSMLDSDQSKVAVYCMEDCDMTYRVICIQLNMLNSKDFQHAKRLYDLESKVAPVLVKMETNGVYIDIERLASIKTRMLELQEKTIQHAKDLLGADFSLSNRDEIENIVYNTYNLDKSYNVEVKTTKTGKKSIDKKTLARFSDNEFVKTYLDAKGREKNIKTYVEPLTEMLSDITGYLHGWFNQTVTTTGRLSCLAATSQILLSDGTFCNIEDIHRKYMQNGPLSVISHTGNKRKILSSYDNGIQEVFEVILESGKKIICTEQHKFLTDEGWKMLSQLSEKDCIYEYKSK